MNIKYIVNILGKILFIEALLMLLPCAVAVIYAEGVSLAYLAVIIRCCFAAA